MRTGFQVFVTFLHKARYIIKKSLHVFSQQCAQLFSYSFLLINARILKYVIYITFTCSFMATVIFSLTQV